MDNSANKMAVCLGDWADGAVVHVAGEYQDAGEPAADAILSAVSKEVWAIAWSRIPRRLERIVRLLRWSKLRRIKRALDEATRHLYGQVDVRCECADPTPERVLFARFYALAEVISLKQWIRSEHAAGN